MSLHHDSNWFRTTEKMTLVTIAVAFIVFTCILYKSSSYSKLFNVYLLAAIDTETDSLIQETIKEVFADCTMLTIAHRLNTVVNYDKILVMEFDRPENLLADRTSEFSKMMAAQESQKQNAQRRGTS
ncbi:hypothetical protein EB796_016723 [Bugula neritina]|uniref:Uncharacterized protein n=1 Tax=Bugula neritina TaxID=10212 RepID=A0A7J7JF89_BUGNE|nr:hypothetical protein EB796_016723 [Bugula neritina]